MSFEPNPNQTLLIFSMLLGEGAEEREPQKSKCKLHATPRDELIRKKFLTLTERTTVHVVKGKPRKSSAGYLSLSDQGRQWALENLVCQLPEKSKRSKVIRVRLRDAIMPLLRERWSEVERRLFPTDDAVTIESIQKQIRDAYLSLTHGRLKERVLLKDLRPKVAAVPGDFDHAVLALQNEQALVLMGLDNMAERTPEVEAAALDIAGHPRHLVYFQG